MRRQTKNALKLSAHHASVALQMLIEDGKIAATDVARALRRREKTIKELRRRLETLERGSAPLSRRIAAARRAARRAAPRARRALTRAQKIARKAQGRYMAAIRRLSKDARAKVKAIRAQAGVEAAIKAAMEMTK